MATDPAAYGAGYAQGLADVQNRVNSATPAEYENSPDYAEGYTAGFAQTTDPGAYSEGEAQGRSDTVHKVSSMPPAYADPNTHYDHPGTPADSYNKGYEAGAGAPPYVSDLEAQEKAERDAREQSHRNSLPTYDPSAPISVPSGPPQTGMHEISAGEEEASKRYTEEKEERERYLEQRREYEDELKRTAPEEIVPRPFAD